MKSLPASTHPVARLVPKNPNWALESTVMFVPGQNTPPSRPATKDQSAHAAVQAAARALRQRRETD